MDRMQTILALGLLANLTIINKAIGSKISLEKGLDLASDLLPVSIIIGGNSQTSQEEKEQALVEAAEEIYKNKYMD